MRRTLRFLWRFTWPNWLILWCMAALIVLGSVTPGLPEQAARMFANYLGIFPLLIFAGVVFLGSAVTGVPDGTRNMFSIYLGIFPMMVPMILLLFNLGRCSTFLQLALSFGGQRRNYFLVIQLFLLFDTLLGYGVLLLLRDICSGFSWMSWVCC